jgi:hypothetical protein
LTTYDQEIVPDAEKLPHALWGVLVVDDRCELSNEETAAEK